MTRTEITPLEKLNKLIDGFCQEKKSQREEITARWDETKKQVKTLLKNSK